MAVIEHTTVCTDMLTHADRLRMFQLMQEYYDGVHWNAFIRDLSEKEHVMVLRNSTTGGEIIGFSTLMRLDLDVRNVKVKAIFSGDTVVREQNRNNLGFVYEVTRYFVRTMTEFPQHLVFWSLICKGWRTYRILPFLFKEFAPCYDGPSNPLYQQVIDAFGTKKYPQEYDPKTGLIKFSGDTQRIRINSPDIITDKRSDPHVDFFAQKNPNYLMGNELVCVAQISPTNFTDAFTKAVNLRQEEVCHAYT